VEKTANKIKEIITPGVANSLTHLVLVNAVYFIGDWLKTFNANSMEKEE